MAIIYPADSISNSKPYNGNYGSNGGLIYDDSTNEKFFITCFHVVKSPSHDWDNFDQNDNNIVIDNNTQQPCGIIKKAVRDDKVDIAIIQPTVDYQIDAAINAIGIPYYTRRFSLNDKIYGTKVKMFGMASKFSIGQLVDYGRSVYLTYYIDQSVKQFNDIIIIKALNRDTFSLPGDSGSYVLDEYNYLVGVLVGGSGNISFVIPIDNINAIFKTKIHTL